MGHIWEEVMVVMLLAGQEREAGAPGPGLFFEYLVRGNMQSPSIVEGENWP